MTKPYPPEAISSFEHGRRVAPGRLWFGILAAPAAWVAQGGLGWFFGERVCTSMSGPSVRVVIAVISVVAIAVAVAGLMTGWRNWQASAETGGIDGWDRVTFMSIGGVIVSASFVVGTVWAGLTPVFIDACGGMR